MAKVKAVKFHSDFCSEGEVRFESGKCYAKSEETERCIALNFCDAVSVDSGEISQPNPTAKERRQSASRIVTAAAETSAELVQAVGLIDQARALVVKIGALESELAQAAEADQPAVSATLADSIAQLKALFA